MPRRFSPPRSSRVLHRAAAACVAAVLACPAGLAQTQAEKEPTPAPQGLSARSIDTITAQFRRHGLATPPATPEGALRVATYNIHELFDETNDPAYSGREEDIGRVMIESRRAATANALRKIDADIVALQEVESLEALRWYRDENLADLGYDHAASEDVGHSLGLEQAVLSRYPIIATQTWADREIGTHPELYRGKPNRYAGQPMTFRRSPLMAEIALVEDATGDTDDADTGLIPEADRLTLLIVHFKTGDGSDAWRAAEGEAIATIIGELKADRPDRRVMVVGDFAEPARGIEPNAQPDADADPAAGDHLAPLFAAGFADAFASLAGSTPDETIATSIYGDRACMLLLGEGVSLAEGAAPFVLGTVAPPERLDRRMGFRMPGFASDHYPVVCDIDRTPGGG